MLEYLDLWGSKVINMGVCCLLFFKILKYLNFVMMVVIVILQFNLFLLLNFCNCDVELIYGDGIFLDSLLREFFFFGVSFSLKDVIFGFNIRNLYFLDFVLLCVNDFDVFVYILKFVILDLCVIGFINEFMFKFQGLGDNFRWIDFSYIKIDFEGVGVIVGYVLNVE